MKSATASGAPLVATPSPQTMVLGVLFSESDYLEMNPDVRAAVERRDFKSGRQHFEMYGRKEGRIGAYPDQLPGFFGEVQVDTRKLSSFRAEHFPYAGPYPWLDRPDWAERLAERVQQGKLTAAEADQCRHFAERGYVILKGAVPAETLDRAWGGYEAAIAAGTIKLLPEKVADNDPWPGRYLDPHLKVPPLCDVMRHPEIMRWVQLLMDREPAPYQTITCHKGSQQDEHSDSIHMTTYPLGYLTAAWIAFEDIHPDCGPLVYYPGSHRLPYYFSKDVGISEDDFRTQGYQAYSDRYVPFIKELIRKNELPAHHFHAAKGDVLIWHANLIHGGSIRRDLQRTRRAMVAHYFVKGAVTYHDLSGALAREHSGTCLLRAQED